MGCPRLCDDAGGSAQLSVLPESAQGWSLSCLPGSVLHPRCGAGSAGEAAQCPAASHMWWGSPGSRALHTELMASLPALSTPVLPLWRSMGGGWGTH